MWCFLTGLLMSGINDEYVNMSLSSAFNVWNYGLKWATDDCFFGIFWRPQLWAENKTANRVLKKKEKAFGVAGKSNYSFVWGNVANIWESVAQAGFSVQFKLAGFDGRGDSISSALSSFEKDIFCRRWESWKLADENSSAFGENVSYCLYIGGEKKQLFSELRSLIW